MRSATVAVLASSQSGHLSVCLSVRSGDWSLGLLVVGGGSLC